MILHCDEFAEILSGLRINQKYNEHNKIFCHNFARFGTANLQSIFLTAIIYCSEFHGNFICKHLARLLPAFCQIWK